MFSVRVRMMLYRVIGPVFLLVLLPGMSPAVEEELRGLMQMLEQRLAEPAATRQAMQAGRDRALLCSYCHGEDGNSLKPEVPNLAGQNPVYLLAQINKFASGERENFVMNSLAREFTLDDKLNLAIYYARQEVHSKTVDARLAEQGRQLYRERCASCHGPRGRGTAEYARLAGQKPEYVRMTLRRFRANANGEANAASVRRSPVMESMAALLNDEQLAALAEYVAGL